MTNLKTKIRTFLFSLLRNNKIKPRKKTQPASAATGLWGENTAADFLKINGYKIVGRRVKIWRDEIDIIAIEASKHRDILIFVEVKTRASDMYGGARASMNKRKRRALCRAASNYLKKLPPTPFRFDLIEVVGKIDSPTPPVIRHHKNTFNMGHRVKNRGQT